MADNQPKYNTKRVLKRYKIIGFVFGLVGLLILIKAGYLMTVARDYWLAVGEKFESENRPPFTLMVMGFEKLTRSG